MDMFRPMVSVAPLDILSMTASVAPESGSISGISTWILWGFMDEILGDLDKAFPRYQEDLPILSASPFSEMMPSIFDQVSSPI